MSPIFAWFGGRKYFWGAFWCLVATLLLIFGKINSTEWGLILGWFFSNVVIANNREAVAGIKEATSGNSNNTESL